MNIQRNKSRELINKMKQLTDKPVEVNETKIKKKQKIDPVHVLATKHPNF